MSFIKFQKVSCLLIGLGFGSAYASDQAYEFGKEQINKMTGCYLVDYSYAETEALNENYQLDGRVYDVNKDKSVKEWIYTVQTEPNQIRLQHILFAADEEGLISTGSIMKHVGEDWEYQGNSLFKYVSNNEWIKEPLDQSRSFWTRKITHLDDGLRYQCASEWNMRTEYPEWACANTLAPIPGRETRDMGRKDYNMLDRFSKVVIYGGNWLERQENTKIVDTINQRIPLVREVGKNWYIRLPDSECAVAQEFAQPKLEFWNVVREAWDEVLQDVNIFTETTPAGMPPRYVTMWKLEKEFSDVNFKQAEDKNMVKDRIKSVISQYSIQK